MKTIRLLKLLIDIIFWGMIMFFVCGLIFFLILFFAPDLVPGILKNFGMLFNSAFPWQFYLVPASTVIGFMLFIVAINYLRKCINPIKRNDFYSDEVMLNLKKTGQLFIIIALGTSLLRLIAFFTISGLALDVTVSSGFGALNTFSGIISAIGAVNFFLLIIGLFLLVFSHIIGDGQRLKMENDLTI